MAIVIRTKRSSTSGHTPSGLELGELAVNIPDKKIWIGDGTATPATIFDPSHITGANHIVADASGNIYITGNLIVSGYLETDVGVRGGTDAALEYLGGGMVMDGGTF
jgi:hypothetical protein